MRFLLLAVAFLLLSTNCFAKESPGGLSIGEELICLMLEKKRTIALVLNIVTSKIPSELFEIPLRNISQSTAPLTKKREKSRSRVLTLKKFHERTSCMAKRSSAM